MANRLVRSSESLRDVIESADYIARESLDAALRFLEAVESTCRFLMATPGAGQLCHFESPEAEGVRVWPVDGFKNHLVFYREMDNDLIVERVLHGARDLTALFNR